LRDRDVGHDAGVGHHQVLVHRVALAAELKRLGHQADHIPAHRIHRHQSLSRGQHVGRIHQREVRVRQVVQSVAEVRVLLEPRRERPGGASIRVPARPVILHHGGPDHRIAAERRDTRGRPATVSLAGLGPTTLHQRRGIGHGRRALEDGDTRLEQIGGLERIGAGHDAVVDLDG
jgi:hypothetical protein